MKSYSVATEFSHFTEEANNLEELKELLYKKYRITEYEAREWTAADYVPQEEA